MEPGDDPYAVLGLDGAAAAAAAIDRSAIDARQIRLAYRQAALKHHPDKQRTDAEKERATREFTRIAAAYELLSDPAQRAAYDQAKATNAAATSQQGYEHQPPYRHSNQSSASYSQRPTNNSSTHHFPFPFPMHFHDPFRVFESVFAFDDGFMNDSFPGFASARGGHGTDSARGATSSNVFETMGLHSNMHHHNHFHRNMMGSFFSGAMDPFHNNSHHNQLSTAGMFGGFPHMLGGGGGGMGGGGAHSSSTFFSSSSSTSNAATGNGGTFTSFVSTSTRTVNGQTVTEHVERRSDGTVAVQRSSNMQPPPQQAPNNTLPLDTPHQVAYNHMDNSHLPLHSNHRRPLPVEEIPLANHNFDSFRQPQQQQPVVIDLHESSPFDTDNDNTSAVPSRPMTHQQQQPATVSRGTSAQQPEIIDLAGDNDEAEAAPTKANEDKKEPPQLTSYKTTKTTTAKATDVLPEMDYSSSNSSSSDNPAPPLSSSSRKRPRTLQS